MTQFHNLTNSVNRWILAGKFNDSQYAGHNGNHGLIITQVIDVSSECSHIDFGNKIIKWCDYDAAKNPNALPIV